MNKRNFIGCIGCMIGFGGIGFIISLVILIINSESELVTAKRIVSEEKYENVVRIFMHNPNELSFMTSDGHKLKQHLTKAMDGEISYYTDVPEVENSWIVVRQFNKRRMTEIEVHLHSPKEIEGGKWYRGGYRSGSSGFTKVIE